MILWYLFRSEIKFKKIVLIIDAKVGLSEFDKEMLNLLNKSDFPVVLVANKVDKLKKSEVFKRIKVIQEAIGDNIVIPYSAKTKKGKKELLDEIFKN